MSNYEERIAALEQTSVSRIDFLNAVNRVMLQQAQSTSETYHEITILLGVAGSQERDIKIIKEDVSTLKGDVSILKGDVSVIKERLVSLETKLDKHTTRFDHLETLLAQVLARLPEKP
ncbi:MAG: hypothetical protein ABI465_20140 [Ktedonobacteraceae bacterium]